MWTPATHNNLHRRVVIPFTWQNEIIGYTARAVSDDVRPKYHNSHEPGYVFNVDQQQAGSKFVIVCEGPFDAMAIDGVAVLGNEVSEQQADIIDSLAREVIVVPDADRAGSRLVDAALEYGWAVSYPEWQRECKDVGAAVQQYGKLFALKSILAGKQTSRLKIELLKKRLYN
jgi:DNA primase